MGDWFIISLSEGWQIAIFSAVIAIGLAVIGWLIKLLRHWRKNKRHPSPSISDSEQTLSVNRPPVITDGIHINNNSLKKLEEFEAKKELLRKKNACIGGSMAIELAHELDNVENEVDKIKKSIRKTSSGKNSIDDEGKFNSQIEDQDNALGKINKRTNRYFFAWAVIDILLICILVVSIFYFKGLFASPKETSPVGNEKISAIVTYPSALEVDKWAEISCEVSRKNDYHGKVLIEFMQNDRFRFENDIRHYLFDFSKTQSPSCLIWTTTIKYDQNSSMFELLSSFRKHIDFVLQNEKGENFAKECVSFQIISFYSVLVNIAIFLISLTGTILSLLRKGKIFKMIVKILLDYFNKYKINN